MRVKVKVVPSSPKQRIVDYAGGLKVYVRSAPEKSKANKELLAMMAKKYKVDKRQVRIISGETSPNKYLEVNKT